MLLRAISAEMQQTLVTDRELTSTAILYRLHVRYQPGGPGEKSIILQQLTNLPVCTTINDLASALRSWRRHFGRAREVEATLPDATLLLKALDPAVTYISKEDAQASFRLAQSRGQLDVDSRPTVSTIWSSSQCILAKAETIMLMSSTPSSTTPVKLKPMEVTPTTSPATNGNASSNNNGKGKGGNLSTVPCISGFAVTPVAEQDKNVASATLGMASMTRTKDAGYVAPKIIANKTVASKGAPMPTKPTRVSPVRPQGEERMVLVAKMPRLQLLSNLQNQRSMK